MDFECPPSLNFIHSESGSVTLKMCPPKTNYWTPIASRYGLNPSLHCNGQYFLHYLGLPSQTLMVANYY